MTEHFAYFSLRKRFGSRSLEPLSELNVDETDGELVIDGIGGTLVFVGEDDEPFRPALRFC